MDSRTVVLGGISGLAFDPESAPRAIVVLLHGYSMEAEDLAPLAISMGLPAMLYCLQAPSRAPRGRAWWPIDEERRKAHISVGPRDLVDEYPAGREILRGKLLAFVSGARSLHPGIPVFLAGFSQGGMLACDAVIQGNLELAGLIVLSASRIARSEWRPRMNAVRGLPVLLAHGIQDEDLALAAGEGLWEDLVQGGAMVQWHTFEGGHGIPLPVWRLFRKFVMNLITTSTT